MSVTIAAMPAGESPDALDIQPDFSLVDGDEDVRQRVVHRLRYWLADWFLNRAGGIPYREMLENNPQSAQVENLVQRHALEVDGVNQIDNVVADLSNLTRVIRLDINGKTVTISSD